MNNMNTYMIQQQIAAITDEYHLAIMARCLGGPFGVEYLNVTQFMVDVHCAAAGTIDAT
jgi:hypothetical protein